jgi:tetratricopeptide (TPR) repeat protein
MLTFFTTCKPFEGATGVAQRNAIRSWLALGRGCEVILVGDDAGTAEAAAELGARHIAEVRRNEFGTPLLDSVFSEAKAIARQDLMCYLNADIMLMGDFLDATIKLPPERLLMISRRWNVTVDGPWDLDDPDWQTKLREHTIAHGVQKSPLGGPDFFVFQRYQWHRIPPFALGRTCFDNWLIYAAVSHGYPVIDASSCIMAVHQNHDCGHADGGWAGAWFGTEAARNRALARDGAESYNFLDATHLMTPDGLVPAMSPEHMARRAERRRAKWFERRLFLAAALHELGRYEDELAVVQQAACAAGTPERTRRYARATLRALLAANRIRQAEDFVTGLLSPDPAPTMGYHLASICQELRAFDLAAALFRAVLADGSDEADQLKPGANYHLAQIAAEMGDRETARRRAEMCLAKNTEHGAAHALLERLDQAVSAGADELIEAVKALQVKGLQKGTAEVPAASPKPADGAD